MRPALLLLACAALFAAESDPSAVVNRALAQLRERNRKIPRYACVETITRDFYMALAPIVRSCDVVMKAVDNRPLDMRLRHVWTDRLRLDVAMAPSGEMHSWVGESRFEEGRIDSIVQEGPVGTGAFGGFLSAIFDQDAKSFRVLGDTNTGGRAKMRFGFNVPVEQSHYKVKAGRDWMTTAYDGMFEAEAENGEVAWVLVSTAMLPPAAGACQTTSRLELGRARLGSGAFLVTTTARQRFLLGDGGEVVNTVEFSGCREYRGDSTVRFETDAAVAATGGGTGTAAAPKLDLPVAVPFSLELTAPIDSANAAAGDPFSARVAASITDQSRHRVVPRGSRVAGRILRVQTFYGPKPEIILVLRPQSVEVRGVTYPLTATGDIGRAIEQQRPVVGKKKGALIVLPYRSETNAGLFRFPGDHVVVKRGFVSYWRTK